MEPARVDMKLAQLCLSMSTQAPLLFSVAPRAAVWIGPHHRRYLPSSEAVSSVSGSAVLW